jgi:hypothetical protein
MKSRHATSFSPAHMQFFAAGGSFFGSGLPPALTPSTTLADAVSPGNPSSDVQNSTKLTHKITLPSPCATLHRQADSEEACGHMTK